MKPCHTSDFVRIIRTYARFAFSGVSHGTIPQHPSPCVTVPDVRILVIEQKRLPLFC